MNVYFPHGIRQRSNAIVIKILQFIANILLLFWYVHHSFVVIELDFELVFIKNSRKSSDFIWHLGGRKHRSRTTVRSLPMEHMYGYVDDLFIRIFSSITHTHSIYNCEIIIHCDCDTPPIFAHCIGLLISYSNGSMFGIHNTTLH